MVERKLNLDIAGAVSELEMLVKKVLPKNVMYQLLLSKGLEFDGVILLEEGKPNNLVKYILNKVIKKFN